MSISENQKRNLKWIVGAGVVVVIFVVWFVAEMKSFNEPRQSKVDVPLKEGNADNLTNLSDENASPDYIDRIDTQNKRNAAQAARSGGSHVDRLTNGILLDEDNNSEELALLGKKLDQALDQIQRNTRDIARRPGGSAATRRDKDSVQPHYVGLDGIEYMSPEYLSEETKAISTAFDQQLSLRTVDIQTSTVVARNDARGTDGTLTSSRTNNRFRNVSSSNASNTNGAVIARIEAMPASDEIIPARLNLGMNTDIGGIATATIVGGEYHGVFLTASSFDAERKYLRTNFDQFCLPEGYENRRKGITKNTQRCGSISAIAVDLDEGVAAVKGKYKSRAGLRVGGTIVASIMEGYGRAIGTNLNRNTVSVDGQVITRNSGDVDSDEALRASAQETGNTIGNLVREFSNRPPTTSIGIREVIGIYIYRPGVIEVGSTNLDYDTGERVFNQRAAVTPSQDTSNGRFQPTKTFEEYIQEARAQSGQPGSLTN